MNVKVTGPLTPAAQAFMITEGKLKRGNADFIFCMNQRFPGTACPV